MARNAPNSDAPKAEQAGDQPMPVTQEEPPELPEEFVRFRGLNSTTRRITEEEWRQAGVADQPGIEWNLKNNYVIAKEHFTDEALELLRADGSFEISE